MAAHFHSSTPVNLHPAIRATITTSSIQIRPIALYCKASVMTRLFSTMPEHKRPTPPSKYRGEGARAICVSNQSLLPSPSAQTITPSKTASSLLDFLIACHKGQEPEPWTVFNITPEEIQTVWLMLERHESLHDYVLGKLR